MSAASRSMADPAAGARILLIEDEALVAENLRADLADAGFEVVAVASRVGAALKAIEEFELDAAIVDANLAGVSAAPAAATLLARRVPCIVLSGYARDQLPPEFSGAVYVQKPYLGRDLIRTLKALIG